MRHLSKRLAGPRQLASAVAVATLMASTAFAGERQNPRSPSRRLAPHCRGQSVGAEAINFLLFEQLVDHAAVDPR